MINWPENEFTLHDLVVSNPNFDSLTLHFLVNRRLADGFIIRESQSDNTFSSNPDLTASNQVLMNA